jgi:hypothetical protein
MLRCPISKTLSTDSHLLMFYMQIHTYLSITTVIGVTLKHMTVESGRDTRVTQANVY